MTPKDHFISFLKSNGIYDDVCAEIMNHHGESLEGFLTWHKNTMSYPGLFLCDGFDWNNSCCVKKESYTYWKSINDKWWSYIQEHNIPDLTYIIKRTPSN